MLLQDDLSHSRNWKKLYTAALVETDNRRMPVLIAQAQKAIIVRARQLFDSGDESFPEEQALDSALHTLKLLGNCVRKAPQPAIREKPHSAAILA